MGKTTTAAALGLAAARAGRRVVVVTVDPARRLADALGLGEGAAGDEPHHVAGIDTPEGGELWALMLDAASTFDRLVREQASSPQQAETLLANPVYRAISGSLSGAQEYMAIERLHELHVSGEWDLVIVDTPPSRHAIDLLEAPDRLIGFLSHPVYRALTIGQRTFAKVTNAAASMFLWAVRRLAGPQIVEDTMEFFRSLANIEPGLRRRAGEVSKLLRSADATFVVVSSPRSEAIGESEHLVDALRAGGFPFGGVVINLIHPLPAALDDESLRRRRRLACSPTSSPGTTTCARSRSPNAMSWRRSSNSPATPPWSSWRCATSTSTTSRGSAASPTTSSAVDGRASNRA